MRFRNDFWLISYTTNHRLDEAMSEVLTKNGEILHIDDEARDTIIGAMIYLLEEIYWEKSEGDPQEYNQAYHTLAKLVLENPEEFLQIFIQLTPGEWVPAKIKYLNDRGVEISDATAYRYLAKKQNDRKVGHHKALIYLEFLLKERYDLSQMKAQECDRNCIFWQKQAERVREVEEILHSDWENIIHWNVATIKEEGRIFSDISAQALYRWIAGEESVGLSLALLLGTCTELPPRREKRRRKLPISSTNPESL